MSGLITPDTYVVNKESMSIIDKNVSRQELMVVSKEEGTVKNKVPKDMVSGQKINDDQIRNIAELCIKIEKHFKKPQDVEWALSNKKIYILQSRSITTL